MRDIEISIRSNIKEVQKSLDAFAYQQLPFATSNALTALAKEVKDDGFVKALTDTLDRPTPFTLNSAGVKPAKKNKQYAEVFVKDIAAGYLKPYEFGGERKLNSQAVLYPKGVPLNQYGNIPRSKVKSLKGRKDIYVGKIKTKSGDVINGVWQRPVSAARMVTKKGMPRNLPKTANTTGKLKLLIKFGDPQEVKQDLNYRERAQRIVNTRFNAVFGAALAKAMATTKR
jgi:hypothetical protein